MNCGLVLLGTLLQGSLVYGGQESFDIRLVARYLFEGDHSDETGFGFHGEELGTYAIVGDLHPWADLLEEDPERGGIYSYTWDEVFYDWGRGGNPRNNCLNLEAQRVLPNVPPNIGITLMTWVKRLAVHTVHNSGDAHFGPIFQLGSCGDHPVTTMAICEDGTLGGFVEGSEIGLAGDQVFVESDVVVTANEWVHCAIVFDRANDVATCYVDGVAQTTPWDISSVSDGVMDFGRAYLGAVCDRQKAFVGQLDDARIYYGALSGAEVSNVYNLNKAPGDLELSADLDFLPGAGGDVMLSWSAEGHCDFVLEPGGIILGQEETSLVVSPAETTTYTLTARNGSGRVSKSQTVVVGAAPEILRFDADQLSVFPGEEVTLAWDVAGATSIEIDRGVDVLNPTVTLGATTTFTLTASNAVGVSKAQLLVEVIPFSDATYLIDFTDTRTAAGRPNLAAEDGRFWNLMVNFHDGRLSPLVDVGNDASQEISLSIVDGFSQVSSNSAEGANAFTELASVDGFLSDVFTSDGYGELLLDGLDGSGATKYTLTFFSSAAETEGVHLEILYTVIGRDRQAVTLDSNGNVDQVAVATEVVPAADGTVLIEMQPSWPVGIGVGINAMKIESHFDPPIPVITSVVRVNGRPTVRWSSVPGRTYAIERSSDLDQWDEVDDSLISLGLEGIWEDPNLVGDKAFYRIIDLDAE